MTTIVQPRNGEERYMSKTELERNLRLKTLVLQARLDEIRFRLRQLVSVAGVTGEPES